MHGIRRTLSRVALAVTLVALVGCSTGCKTGPDGTRTLDVVKAKQAKDLIDPIAASGIRRALNNSPEHAPEIAKYAFSFAGVFCSMAFSNEFRPEFLIAQADKFADPELAKIGDGYLLDIKNGAVGIYKILYGDRFRAEVPPDQWLHLVCEFFCEAINQGLTDAGYPGGVKKTAAGYMRDLNERMNLSGVNVPTLIREPEVRSAAVMRTPGQAPPVSNAGDVAWLETLQR